MQSKLQEDQLTLETFNETIQEMLKQSQVYHQAMENRQNSFH